MKLFIQIFIITLSVCILNAFKLNPIIKNQQQRYLNNPHINAFQHDFKSGPLYVNPLSNSIETISDKNIFPDDLLKRRFLVPAMLSVITLFLRSQPAMASNIVAADITDSSGFVQSFLLIFVSEIGDKTFFIAGLLAAKYGRLISFGGSIAALAVMTIISTVLGQVFHQIPASLTQGVPFDDVIAVVAFSYFGIKTLYDASKLEPGDSSGIDEERAEAEEVVSELTASQKMSSTIALFIQTFSLVFAAEIGDRSFLSTIALSAALNPFAVASGAVLAHASATGILY